MVERHALRSAKAEHCSVKDCNGDAVRSVPAEKASEMAKLVFKEQTGKRVHLCRIHYRQYKKATSEDRELERLSW